MDDQTDGLAHGRRHAEGEDHKPGAQRGPREVDGGDAAAEGKTLEGLVDGDGEEEDEEGGAGLDGEGHADEDAVEEDAGLEEEALEKEFLLLVRRGDVYVGICVGTGSAGGGLAVEGFVGFVVEGLRVEFVDIEGEVHV